MLWGLEWNKKRVEAAAEAKEKFSSWLEISKSPGWKIYEEILEKKIEAFRSKIENGLDLTGEDLKRLQLGLQIYKEVKKIPKQLEGNAKLGEKL